MYLSSERSRNARFKQIPIVMACSKVGKLRRALVDTNHDVSLPGATGGSSCGDRGVHHHISGTGNFALRKIIVFRALVDRFCRLAHFEGHGAKQFFGKQGSERVVSFVAQLR